MYMLDTNIIIFCMRHPRSKCAERLSEHIGKDVCISVVTFAELEYGIMNSGNPSKHRNAINQFLAGIIILDFDMKAALHFGDILAELKQKKRTENNKDRDKMIAAHARSGGFTLVTNNTKDFIDIDGLALEDWTEPGDLAWK